MWTSEAPSLPVHAARTSSPAEPISCFSSSISGAVTVSPSSGNEAGGAPAGSWASESASASPRAVMGSVLQGFRWDRVKITERAGARDLGLLARAQGRERVGRERPERGRDDHHEGERHLG